jgi:hypothetical protein
MNAHFLTLALDGGEWSASRTGRFTPRERAPCTHWIGGWVGPRAVLDVVAYRKIPSPRRESNPRTPIVQPVAQRYTNWVITAYRRIVERRYRSTHFLTLAVDGGEWSASGPGRFTPRERAPCTHYIGGWMGPRTGLDMTAKKKNFSSLTCRKLNPGRPARTLVTILTELPRLCAFRSYKKKLIVSYISHVNFYTLWKLVIYEKYSYGQNIVFKLNVFIQADKF